MSDIYFACVVLAVFSAGLFFSGRAVAKASPPRLVNLIAAAVVALLWLYVKELQESWLLSRVLPFSSLIVLGAWHPLFGGFLGGLAWQKLANSTGRKYFCVVGLCAISIFATAKPFLGAVPETNNIWTNGVCLQTTWYTCSAAAAATLLHEH